jgi:hypothetical protein
MARLEFPLRIKGIVAGAPRIEADAEVLPFARPRP